MTLTWQVQGSECGTQCTQYHLQEKTNQIIFVPAMHYKEALQMIMVVRYTYNHCANLNYEDRISFLTLPVSKRPQRSKMASELNSVTPITYVSILLWPSLASTA